VKFNRKVEGTGEKKRTVQKTPYKVLDAPMLRDDFYLNLIDWSFNNNIAVALHNSIYIWSGCSSNVEKLYESNDYNDYVCSVAFSNNGPFLAFGNTEGEVKLYDLHRKKEVVSFTDLHSKRIGSLGCANNLICTGGRDGMISVQDYRMRTEVTRYRAHQQEICGIKWSPDQQMIASGGNDNKLVLFSLKTMNKMATFN
jgi:cell division cycle 20-like protein 1 (cofactor of APC complex)